MYELGNFWRWKRFLWLWMKYSIHRSSRSQIFFKMGVLKNFSNFTGKHLCRNLFLITLQAWRLATLWKRDSHNCFPVRFENFFRTPILKNVCERLLPLFKNILWPYTTMKKWSHASMCKTVIRWEIFGFCQNT